MYIQESTLYTQMQYSTINTGVLLNFFSAQKHSCTHMIIPKMIIGLISQNGYGTQMHSGSTALTSRVFTCFLKQGWVNSCPSLAAHMSNIPPSLHHRNRWDPGVYILASCDPAWSCKNTSVLTPDNLKL